MSGSNPPLWWISFSVSVLFNVVFQFSAIELHFFAGFVQHVRIADALCAEQTVRVGEFLSCFLQFHGIHEEDGLFACGDGLREFFSHLYDGFACLFEVPCSELLACIFHADGSVLFHRFSQFAVVVLFRLFLFLAGGEGQGEECEETDVFEFHVFVLCVRIFFRRRFCRK